nr:helicase C-terminal domain-containing protein [Candidatus Gracilibacteria bacterium]
MIVALDLETTGLVKEKDSIIEIALIKFDENTFEIVEEFTTLINPGIPIPDLNINITGISDEMVKDSPFFDELKEKIKIFIGDSPILGHNTFFDRDFLIEKGVDISSNIVLDTFFLANFLSLNCKSMSLESLTAHYKIELSGAHRAYNDTKSTVFLFKKLIEEFELLSEDRKKLLNYLFLNCVNKNSLYLKNILFKKDDNLDFEDFVKLIIKNLKKQRIHLVDNYDNKLSNLEEYFSKLKDFETRENQISMAKKIYENFFDTKKTVIEAPTGIGKTIAYLIPAIIYSKKVGKKVFISTKTKILQDQIYYKDLEGLSKSLGIDFTYTKVKGKKNYISLKSLFTFIKDFDIDYDKLSFLSKILLWLFDTEFGELDELFYSSNEYKFLKFVNSDNNQILTEKNPYLKEEFIYKQKVNLDNSDIVIVNHSMLFTDLKNDFNYFGKIENLIIDEAHSIEDIATESLKNSFSAKGIEDIMNFIESIYKNNFYDLANFKAKKEDLLLNIKVIFDSFYTYLKTKTSNENFFISILIDEGFYSIQEEYFYTIINKNKELLLDIKEELQSVNYDFSRESAFLDNIVDILDKIYDRNNADDFIKIAYYSEYDGVKLEYTVLDIGKYLRINFWDYLTNCFLFSATLSIANSFDYIKKSLHLEGFEFLQFDTDFDYSKQATLYIPKDLGSIKNNFSKIQEFLKDIFQVLRGNTMVLFTSLAAVRNVYINQNFFVKSLGSKLLAQSIYGSKNKILDTFLSEHNKSIILGTDSFWEGVDIPGEPLKYLIIHKMPFAVPTDPIYLSRSKLFSNPFSEYSIPKSILKLKQGFGRLIRTKSDSGVVVFLDDRIYSTEWGKIFITAFPKDIKLNITSRDEIIKNINLQ